MATQKKPTGANPSRPVFAIFEGGGAKGVAHVGALKAMEESGLDIIGVAGTSAGALIAVMVAIGLLADDIMDGSASESNIVSRNGESPTSLLGARQWKRFERLRKGWIAPLLLAMLMPIIAMILCLRYFGTLWMLWEGLGHFSSKTIEQFVNKIVRQRLIELNEIAKLDRTIPDRITFAELASGWPTVVPLKIVATDVDHGTLELFDAKNTPNVVVSEAVAASISIPFAFKPALIPSFRNGRFADGGLVSNLPIWSFSEEKLGHERANYTSPPVPILGFTLAAPETENRNPLWPVGFWEYAKRIINATLAGSQGTAVRFLDDTIMVPLTSSLGMVEFDASWDSFNAAREDGHKTATDRLRFVLQAKPDRIKSELKRTRTRALKRINSVRGKAGKPKIEGLRINLIRPFGTQSLRVMESLNMEGDADDRLILDRRGRGTAEAFRERGLRVIPMGIGHDSPDNEFMTKYERALLRSSVKTVIAVPIFANLNDWTKPEAKRPEPAGVLSLDCDEDINDTVQDDVLFNGLVDQSVILYEALNSEIGNA